MYVIMYVMLLFQNHVDRLGMRNRKDQGIVLMFSPSFALSRESLLSSVIGGASESKLFY